MSFADIASIHRIESEIYDFPWTEGIFQDCLAVGMIGWVACCAETIVGYLFFRHAANEAEILNITVSRPYQRQGIGRLLLQQLILFCQNQDTTDIFLEARVSNYGAIHLYQSLGFQLLGRRLKYYETLDQQGEDALQYCLHLKPETDQ